MTKSDVKKLRLSLGMSQAEFASRLGVSRGVMCNVETGRTRIRRSFEAAVAVAFFDSPCASDSDLQSLCGRLLCLSLKSLRRISMKMDDLLYAAKTDGSDVGAAVGLLESMSPSDRALAVRIMEAVRRVPV